MDQHALEITIINSSGTQLPNNSFIFTFNYKQEDETYWNYINDQRKSPKPCMVHPYDKELG